MRDIIKVAAYFIFFAFILLSVITIFSGCSIQKPEFRDGPDVKIMSDAGSHGSGFVLANGFVITAAHVVKNNKSKYTVKTESGRVYKASIMWTNTTFDVAALKIEGSKEITPAQMQCTDSPPQTKLVAHGNPYDMENITTAGYIAGPIAEVGPWKKAHIVDITIGPGMSGGGIYSSGVVVGIGVGARVDRGAMTGFGVMVPTSVVCMLMGR